MLTSLKSLLGYRLHARDGYLGKVDDFHFDNATWRLRSLAAKPHSHWPWRKVLIAGEFVGPPDWVDRTIAVNQTRSEIRHDPPVRSAPPLYREMEIRAANFYELAPHWTPYEGMPKLEWPLPAPGKVELRSLKHLTGYTIVTSDGDTAGRVEDFVADDTDWRIRMLAVRLPDDPFDRTVAVDVRTVSDIAFEERVVRLDMDHAHLSQAPVYNPLSLGNPAFEEEVTTHFSSQLQHIM